jgi:uncharacterized protein YkwD
MGFRRAFFVGLLAVAILPVSGAAGQGEPKLKTGFDPIAASEPIVQRVFDLMNEERAQAGLPPLKLAEKLCVSARWHAMDMAVGNYFEHTDRQGRTVGRRLLSFGYRYRYCGQNIAAGQQTPEEVVRAWMNSPSHRENILRREFREVGIAFVENPNSRYHRYWVQDFGTP